MPKTVPFLAITCLVVVFAVVTHAEEVDIAALTKKAEHGNASAQRLLGNFYANGEGVPKDVRKAAALYRKAAEQGEALAQYSLSECYDRGEGVPQDFAKAVEWSRKAAKQGNVLAQYYLGSSYQIGLGVPQDFIEAAKWYLKAARQGYPKAQYAIGRFCELGLGVPQDYVEAYAWLNLAAISHDESRDTRAKVGASMTSEQIAKGQERSKVLLEQIEARKAKSEKANLSLGTSGETLDDSRP